MCLAIPSKIVKLDRDNNTALVDTMGAQREARLELFDFETDDLSVGDWVLLHIGFVVSKIDETAAAESLKLYEQIVQSMQEQDSQNCVQA